MHKTLDCQSGTNTWQPIGGGLGVGQQWYNVTGSRATGITYTNTTGKPIMVSIIFIPTPGLATAIYVDGKNIAYISNNGTGGNYVWDGAIVPNGSTYSASGALVVWNELR